jgi:hypothetical protein
MERFRAAVAEPEFLNDLCDRISDGENLADMAKDMQANYRWLFEWVNDIDYPDRAKSVDAAVNARDSMAKESIVGQLHSIANLDIRDAYDDKGNLLPVYKMPVHVAKAVSSIDSTVDDKGKETMKVRFVDRGQMLALGGRRQRMFVDKVEMTGQMSLEQAVLESVKPRE